MKDILKRAPIALLLICVYTFSYAQPKAVFNTKEYKYDTIHEAGGLQKCIFHVSNEGTDSLRITNVRPSCGCTVSKWTETPIAPGQKGYISATYNPEKRPGKFRKAISVMTDDPDNMTVVLIISGYVVPRPLTTRDYYPTQLGQLRLKSNHIAMQAVKNNEIRVDTLGIYNDGKTPMIINPAPSPYFLKVRVEPQELNAGEEGFVIISYDGAKRNDYGYVFDKFILKTNDASMVEKPVHVSANIIEDFSQIKTRHLKKAPQIRFDTTSYYFGTVSQGTNVNMSFTFRNEGKKDLIIRKIKTSCGCTVPTPEKMVIKKKESSKIDVVFRTSGRNGKQHKTITVITNDPRKPSIILHIQGNIK